MLGYLDTSRKHITGTPWTALCVVVLTVVSPGHLVKGEDVTNTRTPSKSATEMLERFVRECVLVEPGTERYPATFLLGSKSPGRHELKQRKAALSHSFRISQYELTQELYQQVTGRNPSRWKGPRNSLETVSWQEATQFCQSLTSILRSRKLIDDSEEVRLPTPTEWEYCCRAGTTTKYYFGNADDADGLSVLDQHAWHTGNAAGNDPAVGVLQPNPWGLYDMHGYLWEYVSDGAESGSNGVESQKMIRGGSWRDHHSLLSSSTYLTIPQHASSDAIGIRCVIAKTREATSASDK